MSISSITIDSRYTRWFVNADQRAIFSSLWTALSSWFVTIGECIVWTGEACVFSAEYNVDTKDKQTRLCFLLFCFVSFCCLFVSLSAAQNSSITRKNLMTIWVVSLVSAWSEQVNAGAFSAEYNVDTKNKQHSTVFPSVFLFCLFIRRTELFDYKSIFVDLLICFMSTAIMII